MLIVPWHTHYFFVVPPNTQSQPFLPLLSCCIGTQRIPSRFPIDQGSSLLPTRVSRLRRDTRTDTSEYTLSYLVRSMRYDRGRLHRYAPRLSPVSYRTRHPKQTVILSRTTSILLLEHYGASRGKIITSLVHLMFCCTPCRKMGASGKHRFFELGT